MNILIFSPTPSYPPNSGNRQCLHQLAKFFRKNNFTTHFVYFVEEGLNSLQYSHLKKEWDYLDIIIRDRSIPVRRSLGEVYGKDDLYQEHIGSFLAWKVETFDIKIVFFNYIFQSKALECIPKNVRKILHTHDKMSNRHLMFSIHGMNPEFYYTTEEEERLALLRADVILAVQEDEARYFAKLTNKPTYVMRQLFDKKYIPYERGLLPRTVGYIGSLNDINIESVKNFAAAFKKFRLKYPFFLLKIAGGVSDAVYDLACAGIEVIGKVDDPIDFYKSVDVVVNPMMFGTGLKIKTVEALSCGVPLISTRAGMSGITTRVAAHQCDTIEEMISSLEFLLMQSTGLDLLREASREVFNQYQLETIKQVEHVFNQISKGKSCADINKGFISIADLECRNFYELEYYDDGNCFRWTGPGVNSDIILAINRQKTRTIRVCIINTISDTALDSLSVIVDGKEISHNAIFDVESGCSFVDFFVRQSSPEIARHTLITLKVPNTICPKQLDSTIKDCRSLGLCISGIDVLE